MICSAVTGSSCSPSAAFVVGVMIVAGSFWFSRSPSGKRMP